MKANKGFVMVPTGGKDEEITQMIPFFPYVLNTSIINVDPIDIDKRLHKMSERWILTNIINGIDRTSYIFDCSYKNLTNDDDEVITASTMTASAQYTLYRNGFMDVEIDIRVLSTKESSSILETNNRLYEKLIYLPYNIPENVMIESSCMLGQIDGVSIGASLEQDTILNVNLINPNSPNRRYYNKIRIAEVVPNPPVDSDDDAGLANTATLRVLIGYADEDYARSSSGYADYMSNYLPIKLVMSGVPY